MRTPGIPFYPIIFFASTPLKAPGAYRYTMDKFRLPVVIVGKERVGKTSICLRFCKDTFSDTYRSTLGSQLFEKEVFVDDTRYNLVVWDLGGQDQFNKECAIYIKQAYIIIIAFAVDDLSSFVQLKKWREYIDQHSTQKPDVFVVANKIDLRGNGTTCVTSEQIENVAKMFGFIAMVETSAKTGENISKIFKTAAEMCHARNRGSYKPLLVNEIL